MIDGEIFYRACCADALEGIGFVLHQTALGSASAFDRRSHDPCPRSSSMCSAACRGQTGSRVDNSMVKPHHRGDTMVAISNESTGARIRGDLRASEDPDGGRARR